MSAFLHNGDDVFCVHDAFSSEHQLTDLYDLDYEFLGSVDTNPVKALEYKKDLGVPLVIIQRDPDDVCKSLCKLFGDQYSEEISKCIRVGYDALKEAEVYADLVIPFNEIDERLEEIWELCIPFKPFPKGKSIMYKHLNINSIGCDIKDLIREMK